MKRIISSSHFVPFFLLMAISVFALVDMLHPGIPLTHDGKDHVARIANFYISLSEGTLIPRWAGNLNWGYGHPVLMFLYPLPSYIASFFHFLGFNFSDSLKLVFAFTYIASGFGMYFWLRNSLSKYPALLGGALYLFLPYRFVDMYVRGAIGEHVAFVFPPLVFYFSEKIAKGKMIHCVLTSVAMAGLILSHNAISLMFFPIFLSYFLIQLVEHRNKILFIKQIISILFGFGLSSFFWVPAFVEGKYTLRDVVTGGGEYAERFVSLGSLFYGNWNYGITGQFSTQLGLVGIVVGCVGLILLLKMKKSIVKYKYIYWYVVLFGSIFFMLGIAKPIYEIFSTLQKFQFPWRFLSVSVFSLSVIGAQAVFRIREPYQKMIVLSSLIFLVLLSYPFVRAKGYLYNPDVFYTSVYEGTTDTGESAPIWSVRFMEHRANAFIEVIDGKGKIENLERKSNLHKYTITSDTVLSVVENTLYFPNWEVRVNGETVPVQFQDPNHRGLMTFNVPKGTNTVDVEFKNTKVRSYSDMVSVISILLLIGLFLPKNLTKYVLRK